AGHDRRAAGGGERLGDRAQVPRSGIDDRDHVVRVPLVDGTAPGARGSTAAAWSAARANALNTPSTTCFAFSPYSTTTPSLPAADWSAARANALNSASTKWWGFSP